MDAPLRVLIATFDDVTGAAKGLVTIAPTTGEGIEKAAVVAMDDDGKVRFVETKDVSTGQGAIQGAGVGAIAGLVGLLFGPVGLLGMPIGAAAGALIAKLRDSGYHDDDLKALGADLVPGSSALVATIREDSIEKAERLLKEAYAKHVLVREVDADLASVLDAEVPEGGTLTAEPS